MSVTKRSIFRETAIKQYVQGRDKDILPRFVAPPAFLFLWVLLGICFVAGLLAWNTRVPVYVSGAGIVTGDQSSSRAILFFAPDQLHNIQSGQPVEIHVGAGGPQLKRTVTSVELTLLNPAMARQLYHLDGALSLLVTQPATVVVVSLMKGSIDPQIYTGSIVSADVQVGSQCLFSFVPVVGKLIGG